MTKGRRENLPLTHLSMNFSGVGEGGGEWEDYSGDEFGGEEMVEVMKSSVVTFGMVMYGGGEMEKCW